MNENTIEYSVRIPSPEIETEEIRREINETVKRRAVAKFRMTHPIKSIQITDLLIDRKDKDGFEHYNVKVSFWPHTEPQP